jgi:galactokinase
MTEEFIDQKKQGACRIHGGGFEGTIQVFLPNDLVEEYREFILEMFIDFKIYSLTIRQIGAVKVIDI